MSTKQDCATLTVEQQIRCFLFFPISFIMFLPHAVTLTFIHKQYAIPKINMLCNLCCLKTRLRLLCEKNRLLSSLNLVSQQLKLCNIFIFGMAYLHYSFLLRHDPIVLCSLGIGALTSQKLNRIGRTSMAQMCQTRVNRLQPSQA